MQGLVSGLSQREAYRAAYDCGKMKPESIDQCACRTFATLKVRSRYDALQERAANSVIWNREIAARGLLLVREIAELHIEETRRHKANFTEKDSREIADLPSAATKAILASTAELNKMFGVYDAHDPSKDAVRIVDDLGAVDA